MLVHERGYQIAAAWDGAFTFFRPEGTAIPAAPALPDVAGAIEGCHDADITPGTIIPAWYGERLDLDHAIYVCFANAANRARQRDPGEQQGGSGADRTAPAPAMGGEPVPVASRPPAGERLTATLAVSPGERWS